MSVLPVVPMFHVNAWGVPYAAAMTGAKLVLPGPGLDAVNLTELIENGEGHLPARGTDGLDGAARARSRAGQALLVV